MRLGVLVSAGGLVLAGGFIHAGDGALGISVVRNGEAAAGVQIALVLGGANETKASRVTGPEGESELDLANLTKTPATVVVEDCPDPAADTVYLVADGASLPTEKDKCKRETVGVFWLGKARRIVVDITRGTLDVKSASLVTPVTGGAAGGALILTTVLLTGGGDDTPATSTPTNTTTTTTTTNTSTTTTITIPVGSHTVVRITVTIDPAGHRGPINLRPANLVFAGTSQRLMITGDGNWQPIEVNAAANGTLSGNGVGTFAGYRDIPFTVSGTYNAQTRQILLTVTVGGGKLPGPDITYEILLQA